MSGLGPLATLFMAKTIRVVNADKLAHLVSKFPEFRDTHNFPETR